jgi:hypothetical protein
MFKISHIQAHFRRLMKQNLEFGEKRMLKRDRRRDKLIHNEKGKNN